MISFLIRIAILLVIAIAYAGFDLFNKRNVPDLFVYACLVVGIIITLTYPLSTIILSLSIAAVMVVLGYIIYRKGVIGAGDFFELVTVSLILPIQPAVTLLGNFQLQFPFIFSVLIAAGYSAIICIAGYHLLVAAKNKRINKREIQRNQVYRGVILFAAYMILLVFVKYAVNISNGAVVLIFVVAVASLLLIIFEKAINKGMVSYMYPALLVEGDMIAVNLMSKKDLDYFKSKTKDFGRLATAKMIKKIKGVKRKMPVYTSGIPFAFYILIGVVISLLVGNLLLYVII